MNTITTQQNDTVAGICFKHYGYTKGVVEAVMDANPQLAQFGPVLPEGIKVSMPAPPAKKSTATVKLWS